MVKKKIELLLKNLISSKFNNYLSKKNIIIIFRNGSAIGEHVYLSSVINKLHKLNKKIYLFSNYHFFFNHNHKVQKVFKPKNNGIIWFLLRNLIGTNILEFNSIYATKINHNEKKKYFLYFHKNNKIHLAQAMSEHFNLIKDYSNLKNEFFFSNKEISAYKKELELNSDFALIQSTTKKQFTENKEWTIKGIQKIVNYFKEINWIQIGSLSDPKLDKCKNMLGLDFRKTAYLISKCKFMVTYEGLFNHLASCFNKKNFLIHTGFLPIEAFNYSNNIVIEKNSKMKCYPCYDIECKTHRINCLKNLTEEYVIKKIEKNL